MNNDIDIFLSMAENPLVSPRDLSDMGYTSDNLKLKTKEEYLKDDRVLQNKAFQDEEGRFDENEFNKAYKYATLVCNVIDNEDFLAKTYSKEVFSPYNIYNLDDNLTRKNEEAELFLSANPLEQFVNVGGFDYTSEGVHSIREIAEHNKIIINAKELAEGTETIERYADFTPEDLGFWGNTFSADNIILDKWAFDADINGNRTDDPDKIVYHKGENRVGLDGRYHYAYAQGRDMAGQEVLNSMNLITREDSAWNKFDFMDSDDKYEKSAVGTLMKYGLYIGASFIPYVGTGILAAGIAAETAKMIGSASKLAIGQNAFGSWMQGVGLRVGILGNTTDAAKESTFNFENIVDFSSAIYVQLALQRLLFDKSFALIGKIKGKKYGFNLDQEKWMKSLENINEKKFLKALEKEEGLTKQLKAARLAEYLATNAIRTKRQIELISKAYSELAQKYSSKYMVGLTALPMYDEARSAGAGHFEAAFATIGAIAAETAILNSDLGKWIMPELQYNKVRNRIITETLAKGSKGALTETADLTARALTKEAKGKIIGGYFNRAMDSVKNIIKEGGYKGTLGAMLQGGLAEGVEEVTEEGALDLIKGFMQIMNSVGITEGKRTYTEDFTLESMMKRYGLNFLGGAIGGAGMGWTLRKNFKDLSGMSFEDASQQFLAATLDEEQYNEMKEAITSDKVKFASDKLTFELEEDLQEGEDPIFKVKQKGQKSQNEVIKETLLEELEFIHDYVNSKEGVDFGPNSILNKELELIPDIKAAVFGQSTVFKEFMEGGKDKLATMSRHLLEARSIKHSMSDSDISDLRKNNTDNEKVEQYLAAQKKAKEAEKDLIEFNSGKLGKEYAEAAVFEHTTNLVKKFMDISLPRYIESKEFENGTNRSIEELSPEELEVYKAEYKTWQEGKGKTVMGAYQMYKKLARRFTNILDGTITPPKNPNRIHQDIANIYTAIANTKEGDVIAQLSTLLLDSELMKTLMVGVETVKEYSESLQKIKIISNSINAKSRAIKALESELSNLTGKEEDAKKQEISSLTSELNAYIAEINAEKGKLKDILNAKKAEALKNYDLKALSQAYFDLLALNDSIDNGNEPIMTLEEFSKSITSELLLDKIDKKQLGKLILKYPNIFLKIKNAMIDKIIEYFKEYKNTQDPELEQFLTKFLQDSGYSKSIDEFLQENDYSNLALKKAVREEVNKCLENNPDFAEDMLSRIDEKFVKKHFKLENVFALHLNDQIGARNMSSYAEKIFNILFDGNAESKNQIDIQLALTWLIRGVETSPETFIPILLKLNEKYKYKLLPKGYLEFFTSEKNGTIAKSVKFNTKEDRDAFIKSMGFAESWTNIGEDSPTLKWDLLVFHTEGVGVNAEEVSDISAELYHSKLMAVLAESLQNHAEEVIENAEIQKTAQLLNSVDLNESGIDFTEALKIVYKSIREGSMDQMILTPDIVTALKEIQNLILAYLVVSIGATTDDGSLGKLWSYNRTVNIYNKNWIDKFGTDKLKKAWEAVEYAAKTNKPLPQDSVAILNEAGVTYLKEIDTTESHEISDQLEVINLEVKALLKISDFNLGLKITKLDKILFKTMKTIFSALKSKIHALVDDEDESTKKVRKELGELLVKCPTLDKVLNSTEDVTDTDTLLEMEKELIILGDGIYDIFNKPDGGGVDFDNFFKLFKIGDLDAGFVQHSLTPSTNQISDPHLATWVLTKIAAKQSTISKAYLDNNLPGSDKLPLVQQELGVNLLAALYINLLVFVDYLKEYNERLLKHYEYDPDADTLEKVVSSEVLEKMKKGFGEKAVDLEFVKSFFNDEIYKLISPSYNISLIQGIAGSGKSEVVLNSFLATIGGAKFTNKDVVVINGTGKKGAELLTEKLTVLKDTKDVPLSIDDFLKKVVEDYDTNKGAYTESGKGIAPIKLGMLDIPKVIIVDEVTLLDKWQLDALLEFSNTYGVPLVSGAGDLALNTKETELDLSGTGCESISDDGKILFSLKPASFITTPPLGSSLRTDNDLLSAAVEESSDLTLKVINGQTIDNPIQFNYYLEGSVLKGVKTTATDAGINSFLDALYKDADNVLDNEVLIVAPKIEVLKDSKDSPYHERNLLIQKWTKGDKGKEAFIARIVDDKVKSLDEVQGELGKYLIAYIGSPSIAQGSDKVHLARQVNTLISRAKEGAIIQYSQNSASAMAKLYTSTQTTSLPTLESLPQEVIQKRIEAKKAMLLEITKEAKPIEVIPRKGLTIDAETEEEKKLREEVTKKKAAILKSINNLKKIPSASGIQEQIDALEEEIKKFTARLNIEFFKSTITALQKSFDKKGDEFLEKHITNKLSQTKKLTKTDISNIEKWIKEIKDPTIKQKLEKDFADKKKESSPLGTTTAKELYDKAILAIKNVATKIKKGIKKFSTSDISQTKSEIKQIEKDLDAADNINNNEQNPDAQLKADIANSKNELKGQTEKLEEREKELEEEIELKIEEYGKKVGLIEKNSKDPNIDKKGLLKKISALEKDIKELLDACTGGNKTALQRLQANLQKIKSEITNISPAQALEADYQVLRNLIEKDIMSVVSDTILNIDSLGSAEVAKKIAEVKSAKEEILKTVSDLQVRKASLNKVTKNLEQLDTISDELEVVVTVLSAFLLKVDKSTDADALSAAIEYLKNPAYRQAWYKPKPFNINKHNEVRKVPILDSLITNLETLLKLVKPSDDSEIEEIKKGILKALESEGILGADSLLATGFFDTIVLDISTKDKADLSKQSKMYIGLLKTLFASDLDPKFITSITELKNVEDIIEIQKILNDIPKDGEVGNSNDGTNQHHVNNASATTTKLGTKVAERPVSKAKGSPDLVNSKLAQASIKASEVALSESKEDGLITYTFNANSYGYLTEGDTWENIFNTTKTLGVVQTKYAPLILGLHGLLRYFTQNNPGFEQFKKSNISLEDCLKFIGYVHTILTQLPNKEDMAESIKKAFEAYFGVKLKDDLKINIVYGIKTTSTEQAKDKNDARFKNNAKKGNSGKYNNYINGNTQGVEENGKGNENNASANSINAVITVGDQVLTEIQCCILPSVFLKNKKGTKYLQSKFINSTSSYLSGIPSLKGATYKNLYFSPNLWVPIQNDNWTPASHGIVSVKPKSFGALQSNPYHNDNANHYRKLQEAVQGTGFEFYSKNVFISDDSNTNYGVPAGTSYVFVYHKSLGNPPLTTLQSEYKKGNHLIYILEVVGPKIESTKELLLNFEGVAKEYGGQPLDGLDMLIKMLYTYAEENSININFNRVLTPSNTKEKKLSIKLALEELMTKRLGIERENMNDVQIRLVSLALYHYHKYLKENPNVEGEKSNRTKFLNTVFKLDLRTQAELTKVKKKLAEAKAKGEVIKVSEDSNEKYGRILAYIGHGFINRLIKGDGGKADQKNDDVFLQKPPVDKICTTMAELIDKDILDPGRQIIKSKYSYRKVGQYSSSSKSTTKLSTLTADEIEFKGTITTPSIMFSVDSIVGMFFGGLSTKTPWQSVLPKARLRKDKTTKVKIGKTKASDNFYYAAITNDLKSNWRFKGEVNVDNALIEKFKNRSDYDAIWARMLLFGVTEEQLEKIALRGEQTFNRFLSRYSQKIYEEEKQGIINKFKEAAENGEENFEITITDMLFNPKKITLKCTMISDSFQQNISTDANTPSTLSFNTQSTNGHYKVTVNLDTGEVSRLKLLPADNNNNDNDNDNKMIFIKNGKYQIKEISTIENFDALIVELDSIFQDDTNKLALVTTLKNKRSTFAKLLNKGQDINKKICVLLNNLIFDKGKFETEPSC